MENQLQNSKIQGQRRPLIKINQSFLRNCLPSPSCLIPEAEDLPAYVEPTLACGAHLIFHEAGYGKIYLGSQRSAKSLEALKEAQIGAIVNCTKRVPCYFREDLLYAQVAINDAVASDLLSYLAGAVTFMEHCLSRDMSILVHCEAGVSRSAAVVMAYWMHRKQLSRDQAYLLVKAKRPMIRPNEGFWYQLKIYEQQQRKCLDAAWRDKVDRDWAVHSSSTFLLCRDALERERLDQHCFHRLGWDVAYRKEEYILVCMDYLWGRGLIPAEIDWFVAACHFMDQSQAEASAADGPSSCRTIVAHLLQTEGSKFRDRWTGEVYPTQINVILTSLDHPTRGTGR